MESMIAYLPADRRQALERGDSLPDRTVGSALFAGISGFTPLAEVMARELGPQRGATRRTYGVMGSEVNLAARLMEAAKEGQILIQDTVQQEIAKHFLTEALDPIRVKGRETPIAVSQLVGARLHGSRVPRSE